MSFTLIISNADAKIKLLRILEYLSLCSEDYLNVTRDKNVSNDYLFAYSKIKQSRKLLRMFFSLWNLRKLLKYRNKDPLKIQKACYYLSKICGIVFYFLESITALLDITKYAARGNEKIKRIRFIFWIIGLISSNIFSMTYLIHSYGKEANLKDVTLEKFKPYEIIQAMNDLAEERHQLILIIVCNFMDLFIGCHYAKLIEQYLKTRVTNGVLGLVGVACTVLRLVILTNKKIKHKNYDELFEGKYYGYD